MTQSRYSLMVDEIQKILNTTDFNDIRSVTDAFVIIENTALKIEQDTRLIPDSSERSKILFMLGNTQRTLVNAIVAITLRRHGYEKKQSGVIRKKP